jgi:hypothetical protein
MCEFEETIGLVTFTLEVSWANSQVDFDNRFQEKWVREHLEDNNIFGWFDFTITASYEDFWGEASSVNNAYKSLEDFLSSDEYRDHRDKALHELEVSSLSGSPEDFHDYKIKNKDIVINDLREENEKLLRLLKESHESYMLLAHSNYAMVQENKQNQGVFQ